MGGKVWAGLAGRLFGAGRPRVGGRPRVEAGKRERRKPGWDNLVAKSTCAGNRRLRSSGTRTGANMCSLPHPNH